MVLATTLHGRSTCRTILSDSSHHLVYAPLCPVGLVPTERANICFQEVAAVAVTVVAFALRS